GCKLSTFFAALARYELLKYWRCEKRRREREQAVVMRRSRHRVERGESFHIAWGEFVDTLTRRERDFLEQVLIAPDANGAHVTDGSIGEHLPSNSEPSATNGKHAAADDKSNDIGNGKASAAHNGKAKSIENGSGDDGESDAAESKSPSDTAADGLSQANFWQLRSRVLTKAKRYAENNRS
ncbi:MAG TPA: hypothetical protein VGJ15_13320, partial [Pirellulales bacterium]